MFIALSVKNKVEFVNGMIHKPTSNHVLFPTWKRCNNMVALWLVHSMSTE